MNNYEWKKIIGGEEDDCGYNLAIDSKNNICIIGYQYSESFGGSDFSLIKLNEDGKIIWHKKIGSENDEFGFGIKCDNNDNIYIIGHLYENECSNFSLIKLNEDGEIIWQKKLYNDFDCYGKNIIIDNYNNIYVIGYGIIDDNYNIFIIKLNEDGEIIWQKKLYNDFDCYGYDLILDKKGFLYIIGTVNKNINFYITIKLNEDGEIIWQKKLYNKIHNYGKKIYVDNDNNIYAVGYEESNSYKQSFYNIIKLNENGEIIWQKQISGSIDDNGFDIAINKNNDIIAICYDYNDFYEYNVGMIKLNKNGDLKATSLIFDKEYFGKSVITDLKNNIYMIFECEDVFGGYDFGIVKINNFNNNFNALIEKSLLYIENYNLKIDDLDLNLKNTNLKIKDAELNEIIEDNNAQID